MSESYLHTCPECLQAQVRIFKDADAELEQAGWRLDRGLRVCVFCYEYIRSSGRMGDDEEGTT